MDEEKWDRYEQERKNIRSETQVQLELLTATLATGTVDETVRLLLRSRSLWLDIVGMVESLQMDWQLSDPKEVMLLLVRQARDRERQEAPLLERVQI